MLLQMVGFQRVSRLLLTLGMAARYILRLPFICLPFELKLSPVPMTDLSTNMEFTWTELVHWFAQL